MWLVNGLICKLLNLVPRHQQIVARILGAEHADFVTKTIGVLEILMAFLVLSRMFSKLCTAFQILLVFTMNVIEFYLAPDLLLFGQMNFLVALVFICILVLNQSLYNRSSTPIFNSLKPF